LAAPAEFSHPTRPGEVRSRPLALAVLRVEEWLRDYREELGRANRELQLGNSLAPADRGPAVCRFSL
jgi:hypothetical protein